MKAHYFCIWCSKNVEGKVLRVITDYIKKIIFTDYSHDECPFRVVTTEQAIEE